MDFFNLSVTQRFSKEEIGEIIRTELARIGIYNEPFEFAISNSDDEQAKMFTDKFFDYYDNPKIVNYAMPIIPGGSSDLENLAPNEVIRVILPGSNNMVAQELSWFVLGTILFTLIISTAFFLTIRTLLRQKKLTEIKNDFINNMTHEFKTPLATISLAVDALRSPKVVGDTEKATYFTGIIKEENRRMNKQVETILQAAQLDKNEVQLNLKALHAHDMIQNALNNISLPVAEKGGKLISRFNATNDLVEVDEVHFTNLINNLLDNALKYSKDVPEITLTTMNEKGMLKIQIADNGIGMTSQTLSRIFEKFYRAHTGNVHNVKGFGLGLSYVKTMVEAHKGNIKADSTLGKGSTFTVSFPVIKK